MAPIAFLSKSRPYIRRKNLKFISTFVHLQQEPQLAESLPVEPPANPPPSLPPNPASGSPRYSADWRNPSAALAGDGAIVPVGVGFLQQTIGSRVNSASQALDADQLMKVFADWMTTQRWGEMKQVFEQWIRSLDRNGKPNKPDVNLYNIYLRANLMNGTPATEMLELVKQMSDYGIVPNAASFNMVLKALVKGGDVLAAGNLIDRMLEMGKEHKQSLPDDESFDIVIDMGILRGSVDHVLKYIDLNLESGYPLSMKAFDSCVKLCVNNGRLDALLSIIERCKKMEQNKSLCPPLRLCYHIADVAMQSDNSELTYHALAFVAKWIARGEVARPPQLLYVEEGLIAAALRIAGRTYNPRLLDGAWAVLQRSLRQKKLPSPESYLAKIYGLANLGNLPKAFATLRDFEAAYRNSDREDVDDLFSPFHSLKPLVMACCKDGYTSLDAVYYQLENLNKGDTPYKSIAALNCVIVGCANVWDVDRAYLTFSSIESAFGLTPDIHSYNGLLCAFGKLGKRDEAVKVLEHFVGIGVKPNYTTYSLLVDAHLILRDPRAALAVVEEMVIKGLKPEKVTLKKIRRRCVREMDREAEHKLEDFARHLKFVLGTEARRNMLFIHDPYTTPHGDPNTMTNE